MITDKEIAELRRLAEVVLGTDPGLAVGAASRCALAIPKLLDEIEALRELATELAKALYDHGHHGLRCFSQSPFEPCPCGLSETLKRARAAGLLQ